MVRARAAPRCGRSAAGRTPRSHGPAPARGVGPLADAGVRNSRLGCRRPGVAPPVSRPTLGPSTTPRAAQHRDAQAATWPSARCRTLAVSLHYGFAADAGDSIIVAAARPGSGASAARSTRAGRASRAHAIANTSASTTDGRDDDVGHHRPASLQRAGVEARARSAATAMISAAGQPCRSTAPSACPRCRCAARSALGLMLGRCGREVGRRDRAVRPPPPRRRHRRAVALHAVGGVDPLPSASDVRRDRSGSWPAAASACTACASAARSSGR